MRLADDDLGLVVDEEVGVESVVLSGAAEQSDRRGAAAELVSCSPGDESRASAFADKQVRVMMHLVSVLIVGFSQFSSIAAFSLHI